MRRKVERTTVEMSNSSPQRRSQCVLIHFKIFCLLRYHTSSVFQNMLISLSYGVLLHDVGLCSVHISGGSRIFQTGGANPKGGGRQPIIWPIAFGKLHENERTWTESGCVCSLCPSPAPLDPPMMRTQTYYLAKFVWKTEDPPPLDPQMYMYICTSAKSWSNLE